MKIINRHRGYFPLILLLITVRYVGIPIFCEAVETDVKVMYLGCLLYLIIVYKASLNLLEKCKEREYYARRTKPRKFSSLVKQRNAIIFRVIRIQVTIPLFYVTWIITYVIIFCIQNESLNISIRKLRALPLFYES